MAMCRNIVLLVGVLTLLGAAWLPAQDAVLGQKYGHGVHAYFSGDYSQAFEQLTAAINGGSKDPRAFYFRGLAYSRLGRPQEAKQDFQKGAELESKDVNRFYDVAKALERVQGPVRIELESYRVEARMAVMEQTERLRKARYEAIQREESRVLREQPPEPIKTPEPTAEPAAADPFGATEEKPATKADKPAAGPAGEKKAAGAPAGDDPFALPSAKPAEKPAAAKKTGMLGAMGKALGKAVGGEADRPPAGEKKPAAQEKPADAANPFAEEPAAEKKPATDKKPAKAAATKPAEKKASPDDPFAK
jgi:tetratricopeptide (TPR) repeat protein